MDDALALLDYAYLTTTGRHTGAAHRIEIWFAAAPDHDVIYMLAGDGERADWIRNLRADARCTVEIGDRVFSGHARDPRDADEERRARDIVYAKYAPTNGDLESWREDAVPIVIDVR
ncbi:MAG TPA: nitroreductase/quinone reductase family protein [Acidimicrobiia bacterium]|nr:nitroreductase/quinone reductase family protein [Acidimicrobiia bacterium]